MSTPLTDAVIYPVPGRDAVTGEKIDVVHVDDARAIETKLTRALASMRTEIEAQLSLACRLLEQRKAAFVANPDEENLEAFTVSLRNAERLTALCQLAELAS